MDNRNLVSALAVAALLIIAVTTAGCATNTSPSPTTTPIPATQKATGNNITFSSAAGFNITYPKNLTIDSSQNASDPVRVYIYLAPNNTIDGVLVANHDLGPNDTLNDFTTFNKNEINNYANYTTISNNTTTFAGKPAYNIVWQATVPVQLNTTAVKNMTLKVMQTYVINKSTGYVITYKAIPSDYDTYLAQAQRIMNTFQLT